MTDFSAQGGASNPTTADDSTTRASETAAAAAVPATRTSIPPGASTTPNTTNAAAPIAQIGPYIPGSMPPPRISLRQPKNDTTGYIIDKIMMPRSLPHFPPGHKQTVAIYYVGYRDRPIERGLVPYNEILQHVSLRELEEWEDQLPQMIEENKREDAEARRYELEEERQRERQRGTTTGRVTRGMRRRMGMGLGELDINPDEPEEEMRVRLGR